MLIVFLTGLQCSQVTKSLLRLMQDIEASLLVKKVNNLQKFSTLIINVLNFCNNLVMM